MSIESTTTKKKTELRPIEVGVGAGAAVLTAFASSYLGTAGTLTGAALASVVGTVSTSVLRSSAQTGAESLRRTTGRLRNTRTGPELGTAEVDPVSDRVDPTAAGTAEMGAGVPTRTSRRVRPRWVVLGVGAAASFVLAMLAITGIESAAGKPLAAITGGDSSGGTTVGKVTGTDPGPSSDRGDTTPTPTPTATPTDLPSASATESADPSGDSTPSAEATTSPEATASPDPAPPATQPAPSATGSPVPLTSPTP